MTELAKVNYRGFQLFPTSSGEWDIWKDGAMSIVKRGFITLPAAKKYCDELIAKSNTEGETQNGTAR